MALRGRPPFLGDNPVTVAVRLDPRLAARLELLRIKAGARTKSAALRWLLGQSQSADARLLDDAARLLERFRTDPAAAAWLEKFENYV